jgi:hypothetical protein
MNLIRTSRVAGSTSLISTFGEIECVQKSVHLSSLILKKCDSLLKPFSIAT